MTSSSRDDRRDQVGYGSTYRRGDAGDAPPKAIPAVLGGQVWMVKPDTKAKSERPCLWMQAGAVKFKSCTHYYDCATCSYDHAMGEKARAGKQVSWQDAMRRRPEMQRLCRHVLTGRCVRRTCAYDYRCATCDFDQYFEEVWSARTPFLPSEIQRIKGFEVPVNHCFHVGHTWARVESGGGIRVGMDDFALKLLGRADAFELPLMGKELSPGRPSWGLRRRGNSADVLSPVGGVITEVNPKVRETPAEANREPYGQGWLFLVHSSDVKSSMKPLMADQQAMTWMSAEVDRLHDLIEEVAGPLAADGGHLADDIYGNLPRLDWRRLTQAFLRT